MINEKTVAVLFARKNSIYKNLTGCNVYDKDWDALTFKGRMPIVAHPPCRAWGRLRYFAKPLPGEKEFAIWAVDQVQKNGGILEHPTGSKLWHACNLPKPLCGQDQYGGFTLQLDQFWFGHRAKKSTWLYICGVEYKKIPAIPLVFGEATHVISSSTKKNKAKRKPEVKRWERESTPIEFAKWLVKIARMVNN